MNIADGKLQPAERQAQAGDRIIAAILGSDGTVYLRQAVVVRTWSDTCVNAIAFLDGSNDAALGGSQTQHTKWLTSIIYEPGEIHPGTFYWPGD